MSDALLSLPNFLIPYRDGVENYTDAPETVGKIVIAVASMVFRNEDISANLSPCERGVYRQWLKVAEEGIEKASRERRKMQKAAAARWGNGGESDKQQSAVSCEMPAPVPKVDAPQDAKPEQNPAPVKPSAPVPRPVPNPRPSSDGQRRGGCLKIGDCMGGVLSMLSDGGGIDEMINAEPVKAALRITGETGNRLAENTLKKYLREKGAAAFCETLFAFNSELKNDTPPDNLGAALNRRLNDLPNLSADKSTHGGAEK